MFYSEIGAGYTAPIGAIPVYYQAMNAGTFGCGADGPHVVRPRDGNAIEGSFRLLGAGRGERVDDSPFTSVPAQDCRLVTTVLADRPRLALGYSGYAV